MTAFTYGRPTSRRPVHRIRRKDRLGIRIFGALDRCRNALSECWPFGESWISGQENGRRDRDRHDGRVFRETLSKSIPETLLFDRRVRLFIPYSAAVFIGLSYLFKLNFHLEYGIALLFMGTLTAVYLTLAAINP